MVCSLEVSYAFKQRKMHLLCEHETAILENDALWWQNDVFVLEDTVDD